MCAEVTIYPYHLIPSTKTNSLLVDTKKSLLRFARFLSGTKGANFTVMYNNYTFQESACGQCLRMYFNLFTIARDEDEDMNRHSRLGAKMVASCLLYGRVGGFVCNDRHHIHMRYVCCTYVLYVPNKQKLRTRRKRPLSRSPIGNRCACRVYIADGFAYPRTPLSRSACTALTIPCGNVFKTGESSRALILTVAPPNPTTTYLFLEAAADRRDTRAR